MSYRLYAKHMDLAIDIGGTKTLFAVFSPDGKIVARHKMPTSQNYKTFLKDIDKALKNDLRDYKFNYCCCAVPGRLDRKAGVALAFGNLPWLNVPIEEDLSKLLGGLTVHIENDGKLAALYEGLLFHKKYNKVLYLTVGTGIGDGLVIDGKLDEAMLDSEAGQMVLPHDDKLMPWEDFASGRAIVARFGKRAADITDPAIWATYARDLAQGLIELLAVIEPEVVIIGGGVGAHFDKYGHYLKDELKKMENDMVNIPPVIAAKRPEEAVIYGCYEYIKQQH